MSRRAERFAAVLDGRAVATDHAGVAPLAELATALRAVGSAVAPPPPSPDFRAGLRQRLVAVATVTKPAPPPTRSAAILGLNSRVRRRVGVLAGGVTMATAVAGVGVAATRSLPGDPFYGVKRATEDVQLWTARGNLAKGHRHLEFARTRLAEARALRGASPSTYESTLRDMDSETRQGTAELLAAARSSRSATPLADLDRFARAQYAGLIALAGEAPATIRAAEAQSIAVLATVEHQVNSARAAVTRLAPTPGGPSRPGVPGPSAKPSPTPSAHPDKAPVVPSSPNPAATTGRHPSGHPTAPSQLVPSKLPTKLPTKLPSVPLPDRLPTPNLASLPPPPSLVPLKR